MADDPRTEVCAICGNELPEDPPTITIPDSFSLRVTPLTSPGITKLAFCSERHERDWKDGKRGEFPDEVQDAADGPSDE